MKRIIGLGLLLILTACASAPAPFEAQTVEQNVCESALFRLDADFQSGGMAGCKMITPTTVEVFVRPENTPINLSPWYAVRLTPFETTEARIVLRYSEHPHRYHPKTTSADGIWTYVPEQDISRRANGFRVTINVDLDEDPVFLAGQELFTNAAYEGWIETTSTRRDISRAKIGNSIEGRPIEALETSAKPHAKKTVMLVGRQHPPEITGALAMISFMEEILGKTELATTFRDKVHLVMVPNMNPDGVEHGYWRHNLGGLDLNRDWGPFTQPETQAVKQLIDEIDTDANRELVLFLDFHSTQKNVFYTQSEDGDEVIDQFTAQWLSRAGARIPDYDFVRAGDHNADLPTSKTYMFDRFGIPAITYEIGDETDRALIQRSAKVFAQEMMKRILELGE